MKAKIDELSDEELMKLYQQGHEAAFTRLYLRYETRVYGFLRKRLADPQSVNDVFQASFLKLHRSKEQFNSSYMFAPWLFTVVRTSLLDYEKNRKSTSQFIELEEHAVIVPPIDASASLRSDLSQIPETQRLAVEMRYFDDLSFEEIATRLNTSSTNARQLVSRGIKALKSFFKAGGQL